MKDVFVVIEIGGTQHIVSVGHEIDINHIDGKVGDKIAIDKVYLRQDDKDTDIGNPTLDYTVTAEILKQFKGPKLYVRKYKAKARYRRTYGHRQVLTRIKITRIAKKTATTQTKSQVKPKAKPSAKRKSTTKAKSTTKPKTKSTKSLKK